MNPFPWFTRGDLDGFFGLFVDNLLQLVLIVVLCAHVVELPAGLIHATILPAAALSILAGNFFYAWQARKLAMLRNRPHTTALPYGINTVSLFAYVFLVMAPVAKATGSATLAWQAGLFACLGSGFIEMAGSFFGPWLRRHTPRAALLSALAGIAITFISMGFVFQIFANPAIAVIPAFLILIAYGSRARLPLGLPAGLAAVLLGTAVAWAFRGMGFEYFQPDPAPLAPAFHFPVPVLGDALAYLGNGQGWAFFASVVLPMGLFNVIGSMQNLESAEAAGDRYPTRSSLLVNGGGTVLAALLGSPFPTTIYIGHPGWKAMGARWGYSIANGAVIALICLLGAVTAVLKVVPLEAMIGILLWIGIVIAAQSFKDVPRHHHLAVAFGFVPSLAAWGLLLVETSLRAAGSSLYEAAAAFGTQLYIHGMIALNQGFIITATVFAAILVHAVERRFLKAAAWACAAAFLAFFGVIHAYTLGPSGLGNVFAVNAAPAFSAAYLVVALMLLFLHRFAALPESRNRFNRGGRGGRREGFGRRGPDDQGGARRGRGRGNWRGGRNPVRNAPPGNGGAAHGTEAAQGRPQPRRRGGPGGGAGPSNA